MKRLFAIILAFMIVSTMVACDGENVTDPPEDTTVGDTDLATDTTVEDTIVEDTTVEDTTI